MVSMFEGNDDFVQRIDDAKSALVDKIKEEQDKGAEADAHALNKLQVAAMALEDVQRIYGAGG